MLQQAGIISRAYDGQLHLFQEGVWQLVENYLVRRARTEARSKCNNNQGVVAGPSFLRVLGAFVLAPGSSTSTHKIHIIGTQLKRKAPSFIDI